MAANDQIRGYIPKAATQREIETAFNVLYKIRGNPTESLVGAHALGFHSDVAITTPTLNDYLYYNGSTWVNSPITALPGPIDYIQFDTTHACVSAEGKMCWNADEGTINIGMPGGNVVLFTDVLSQIIKLQRTIRILVHIETNSFPVAHSHGLFATPLVKLPVKEFMPFLSFGPAH